MLSKNQELSFIAITGYIILLVSIVTSSINTASILMVIGVGALIYYHYIQVGDNSDEETSKRQLIVRQVAHTAIVASLVISMLTNGTLSWETIALVAHISLLWTVTMHQSQKLGVILLATYFVITSIQYERNIVDVVARALLCIFFISNLF